MQFSTMSSSVPSSRVSSSPGRRRLFGPLLVLPAVLGLAALAVTLTAAPAPARAAEIKLADGTVLNGTAKKLGGSYSIKLDSGEMRLVTEDQVVSIDGKALGGGETDGGAAVGGSTGVTGNSSAGFQETKQDADRASVPSKGSAIWQDWIDTNPASSDLDAAKAELDIWKKRSTESAQKVKGKWMGGKELEDLKMKVDQLTDRASLALQSEEPTLGAIKDLNEAYQLYPEHIPTLFYLGYWNALKNDDKKAKFFFEQVLRQKPKMVEAMNNVAVEYLSDRQYEKAITIMHEAVQLDDQKIIVQNLINAINAAPRAMYTANPKIRPIVEDAQLLARKHGINGAARGWILLHIKPSTERSDEEREQLASGIIGYGSGFFISADGLIMTNRHVAEEGDSLIVRLADGTEKQAERVVIDEDQDIAILRIKTDEEMPFIPIAAYDEPNYGAPVTIFGFPLGDRYGRNVKITTGVVTSIDESNPMVDVITEATVNPGNSGGAMVDKYGHLLGLVAMKSLNNAMESSYGMGLSPGRLRIFLEKHAAEIDHEFEFAKDGEKPLSTEDLATKLRPAAVQIIMVND